jgi:UDP-N-acetylglucosamine 2-epimerase (non-hydrolysing)
LALRILTIIGTRPEAIKMAPVVLEIEKRSELFGLLLLTGQHQEMLDSALATFGVRAGPNLSVMRQGQSLNSLFGSILKGVDEFLEANPVDLVLVHGDTTSASAGALAAFHRRIPVGHVEAGLRTFDLDNPYPEEMNRCLVDVVAKYQFAPTENSAANLKLAGSKGAEIIVTGNTVIDALMLTSGRIDADAKFRANLSKRYPFAAGDKRLVLVTGHRRENFGGGIENLCAAIGEIAAFQSVVVAFPVHPNPNVIGPVRERLAHLNNVHLLPPADYHGFVYLMKRAALIITDSGGVQEEAPSLGCPVLVTRIVTERPEALQTGRVELVGSDKGKIVAAARKWLKADLGATVVNNPYGDGQAARRIVDAICRMRRA